MSFNQVSEPLVEYLKAEQHEVFWHVFMGSFEDAKVFQDTLLMNQVSEQGIPYYLFQQIQEAGPLTLLEWADLLGVSSKTLTRYRKEGKLFQPGHSTVILQITELISLGIEVFGEKNKLYRWLKTDTFALGGRSPLTLLTNAYGRDLVLRELTQIEHGIFA